MGNDCKCGTCFHAVKTWIGLLEYVWKCLKCGDTIINESFYQDWR